MLLFFTLHKVVLILKSVSRSLSVTIQMKATEQYFPVVLLIKLCKSGLSFVSVDKIL